MDLEAEEVLQEEEEEDHEEEVASVTHHLTLRKLERLRRILKEKSSVNAHIKMFLFFEGKCS